MAKSAPGWMAPALALATLIAWERRWSELRRWELYVGLLLQVLIIGPWIMAVTAQPQGREALQTLFWHNVVGRFTKVAGPEALDYTTGHRNVPGKYFLELPVYLLPWSLLVAAALRRAWDRVRVPGPAGSPWRFAVSAALPFLVVLSLAATARDIYSAPALLGFGLLVALWLADARLSATRFDKLALRWTRWLVTLIACGFALFPATLALATGHPGYLVATVIALLAIFTAATFAARAQASGYLPLSFGWTFASYASALCVLGLATFPAIDRWHDLGSLARRIRADSAQQELAVLAPDETTIAMLDDRLRTPFTILANEQAIPGWLGSHGARARVLVLLPGHAPGDLTRLLARVHPIQPPDDGMAGKLTTAGVASLLQRYDVPQGRRYALLGPPVKSSQQDRPLEEP